ncbi:MAG: 50S ribosomal protein L15 [Chloroflexi bacterium]|jgi:large subunit ribosomal protein L15|nr:50S ribosomal protein L15 [Chloroflexota bacterium]MCH2304259.1 50S ribosomal protein L15 [SAR202 cluster bacterium]|tara:strand:+ start:28762 stop:29205 length:444 start_codon:yes stop_codon:yes gene_type:complete
MRQHLLKPSIGKKSRKRVGRGNASGFGNYSGRGMKGQKSRSGGGVRLGFEGGQLPLIKKLPMMRGFTNIFKKKYFIINVGSLSVFPSGALIDSKSLFDKGLIKNIKTPVKILGDGEITQPLEVTANKFSKSAIDKIESVGGTIKEIN